MSSAPLELRLGGQRLAVLADRGMGFVALAFTEEARARYGEGSRMLSLSLPVRDDVPVERATQFLRGLLPEGRALDRVAQQLRLSTNDTFGLLRALGRDCAGAVVIVPPGEPQPVTDDVMWLTEADLARSIAELVDRPLGLDPEGDVRLSLAGVQDKLVVRVDPERGTIGLPLRGAPSSHILKPASLARDAAGLPRTPAIVENEAFCLHLARASALPVAAAEIRRVEGERALLVERYDRRRVEGRVLRIHQEDTCQALGLDPLHKYEEHGGPSLSAIAGLVRAFAAEPLRDLYRLLDLAVFNLVVGNLDAHGKNISFLHHEDGRVALAPAYDLLSVTVYPAFAGGRLAMKIGEAERPDEADAGAVVAAYAACRLPERVARRRLPPLLTAVEQALAPTLAAAAGQGWHVALLDEVAAGARRRIERLRDG